MPTGVEIQLRALGRQLEREVAHVDADEVLDAATMVEVASTTPSGPSVRRHRWRVIVAAVAVAAIAVILVLRPGDHAPRPPSATTTSLPSAVYPQHAVRPLFPEAGPLATGEHRWILKPTMPTPLYRFTVPTPGWRSGGDKDVPGGGGWIEKGTPGRPDGAVITFWRPDNVYADPCGHTLSSSQPSALDLSRAVAAIPGTELVSGPTRRFSGQQVVLTIPDGIECDPQQFYLWAAGEHPRAATERGSTITVSIIAVPELAGLPQAIFVEAQTYKGASPELEREVQQIIDSFRQDGGIG
jgi:hypothetical protein